MKRTATAVVRAVLAAVTVMATDVDNLRGHGAEADPPRERAATANAQKGLAMRNQVLELRVDAASGSFEIMHLQSGRLFVKKAVFSSPVESVQEGDNELAVALRNGWTCRLWLPRGSPFAHIHFTIRNNGTQRLAVRSLDLLNYAADCGVPWKKARALGSGGLGWQGSHSFLAVADPETGNGVISGWLTHEIGTGYSCQFGAEKRSRPGLILAASRLSRASLARRIRCSSDTLTTPASVWKPMRRRSPTICASNCRLSRRCTALGITRAHPMRRTFWRMPRSRRGT